MFEIYTAGFLDADGSVSLCKPRKDMKDYARYPCVEFYNCDKAILDKIHARWGGGISIKLPRKKTHNVSYELTLIGTCALKLLKDVSPYMMHQKKSKRANLIVQHYERCTPRNGKYTEKMIEEKVWLVEQVMGMQMRGIGAY